MRTAVGAVYQTRDALACERLVPALPRRTPPRRRTSVTPIVSGAMMPYDVPVTQPGIGGAPEDVVGVQVEREPRGRVVRDDRLVHVHRALRRARRAAREVQQRELLGLGRRDRERRACAARPRRGRARRARRRRRRRRAARASRLGQLGADRRDLAPVQRRRRDEHPAVAELQALADRLRDRTPRTAARRPRPSFSAPSTATCSSGTRPSSVNTRSPGAHAERCAARWRSGSSARRARRR